MPHINLPEGIAGILGPMAFSPQTAKPLNELAEALLRAPNSLTQGEREMITTYVSAENDCFFARQCTERRRRITWAAKKHSLTS
jgi:alkylhydroperoxidase family enzyme